MLLGKQDWLKGYGVAVHLNTDKCTGTVDYVNKIPAGYEWQCVELVNRLYLKRGWITTTWQGNGNQMYATAPTYLHKQRQGSIRGVRPGDVISMTTPTSDYGHAAVINTVTKAQGGGHILQIVNQNTPEVYSYATLSDHTITLQGWTDWHIIGVIHAPQ